MVSDSVKDRARRGRQTHSLTCLRPQNIAAAHARKMKTMRIAMPPLGVIFTMSDSFVWLFVTERI